MSREKRLEFGWFLPTAGDTTAYGLASAQVAPSMPLFDKIVDAAEALGWGEPLGDMSLAEIAEGLLQGKTIVGALLGGLVAVEAIKRIVGIRERSGDAFVLPLAIGISACSVWSSAE